MDSEAGSPEQDERRRRTWIISGAVAVVVLLCCCCLAGYVAWTQGDAILEALNQLGSMPTPLT